MQYNLELSMASHNRSVCNCLSRKPGESTEIQTTKDAFEPCLQRASGFIYIHQYFGKRIDESNAHPVRRNPTII